MVMDFEDLDEAVDAILTTAELDGRPVDPALLAALVRVAAGELTAEQAMRELRGAS